jgi:hypothetical protein
LRARSRELPEIGMSKPDHKVTAKHGPESRFDNGFDLLVGSNNTALLVPGNEKDTLLRSSIKLLYTSEKPIGR